MITLSWNIYKGGVKHVKEIKNEILTISPDIICLQEATDEIFSELDEFYDLQAKVPTHCCFCAILTKKGLVVTVVLNYFQSAVSCVVDNITYVSCHLVPYQNNEQFRLEQLTKILNRVTTNKIVIAGDMNMYGDVPLEFNLLDVGKQSNESTWFESFFEASSINEMRFDRFFVSKDIQYEYKVIKKMLSDHFPIILNQRK